MAVLGTFLVIEFTNTAVSDVGTIVLPLQDALVRVSFTKDGGVHLVAIGEVELVGKAGHTVGVDSLEIFVLRTDDHINIVDALPIVGLIMRHGSTPEIDVGQQCMHGIAGEIAHIAPVSDAIATRLHDVALGLFQVADAELHDAVRSGLRNNHDLVVVLVGLGSIRNVTECPDKIEVAETTQSQHLSAGFIVVTLCELRIEFHHILGMVEDNVAAVDDTVEIAPGVVAIRRKKVDSIDVIECSATIT